MESKAIKEYDDFGGQDGYLIVDGLTDNESGGKMKVPNYSGVTDGYVLTKTTTDGADDVVWAAPAGGECLVPNPQDLIGKQAGSGTGVGSGTLRIKYHTDKDDQEVSRIISIDNLYWDI